MEGKGEEEGVKERRREREEEGVRERRREGEEEGGRKTVEKVCSLYVHTR